MRLFLVYFLMTIGQMSETLRYVLRIDYDYHFENIVNIQNISPILVAGDYFDAVSACGIFASDPLRRDWGDGINVTYVLGSPQ